MKTFKKCLAVILSIMMIASVIVVPAAAEETAELITKEISIFDLSDATVGTTVTGSDSAIRKVQCT